MARHFPHWIRRTWGSGDDFGFTKGLLSDLNLHTVCQSARCPNIGECWARHTATFMLLGNTCTRDCRFCAVCGGVPEPVDPEEPWRVAEAIRRLELGHAVITSVTRDDLPDGGAAHFRATVEAIRAQSPETTIEVLVPDFNGDREAIACVLEVAPDVFGHNIETVARLYSFLRGERHSYTQALDVLRTGVELAPKVVFKSALMAGHGETAEEVRQTLTDLLLAGCEAVSIGQYLQPTPRQCRVLEFVPPDQFASYEEEAYRLGFRSAVAGPFVRSSYRSEELLEALRARLGPAAMARRT